MNRHQEILELLRSVDPARVAEDAEQAIPGEGPSARYETAPARGRSWVPALVAFLIAVPLLLTSIAWVDLANVSAAELVGTYRGSLIRDGGPGEADVRQWVEVVVTNDQGEVAARLSHSSAGAVSFDPARSVLMPVEVTVSGRVVELAWDESLGIYEDTTAEQCRWVGWQLVMEGDADGDVLTLDRGVVDGQPPAGSEVGEFLSGCPHGERPVTRLVLTRR